MVKVNVVAVGKVKEKYFADGIKEYAKRMSRFAEFKIIEVAEENFTKVDDATVDIILAREGERIKPHLKGYIVVLAIEGKKQSSESFAKALGGLIDNGQGVITFVIGGSYGISDEIKKKANAQMSFSEMTFPHTLFRLMLVEQIYRAFSILGGSAYHK